MSSDILHKIEDDYDVISDHDPNDDYTVINVQKTIFIFDPHQNEDQNEDQNIIYLETYYYATDNTDSMDKICEINETKNQINKKICEEMKNIDKTYDALQILRTKNQNIKTVLDEINNLSYLENYEQDCICIFVSDLIHETQNNIDQLSLSFNDLWDFNIKNLLNKEIELKQHINTTNIEIFNFNKMAHELTVIVSEYNFLKNDFFETKNIALGLFDIIKN
jgi:hypothetical protein